MGLGFLCTLPCGDDPDVRDNVAGGDSFIQVNDANTAFFKHVNNDTKDLWKSRQFYKTFLLLISETVRQKFLMLTFEVTDLMLLFFFTFNFYILYNLLLLLQRTILMAWTDKHVDIHVQSLFYRCVPDKQRSVGIGVNLLFVRLVGK